MRVFRSVLGLAPGNAEALHELEEMEHAFAKVTASGRAEAEGLAARLAAAVGPTSGSRAPQTVPAAARNASARIRVASSVSLPLWGIVGAAILAVVVVGGAALYLGFSPQRAADTGSASDAPTAPPQASDQPASTPSNVASPPPAPPPPAVSRRRPFRRRRCRLRHQLRPPPHAGPTVVCGPSGQ